MDQESKRSHGVRKDSRTGIEVMTWMKNTQTRCAVDEEEHSEGGPRGC
jgi:hypothetical protein